MSAVRPASTAARPEPATTSRRSACTPEGRLVHRDRTPSTSNSVCLTDAQLQGEVSTMVAQTGILGRTQPGYTPLVTLLLPPGVETCLDATQHACSANGYLTPPPPEVSAIRQRREASSRGRTWCRSRTSTTGGESVPSASQTVTTTGTDSTITVTTPPDATEVTGWYAYVTPAERRHFQAPDRLQRRSGPTPRSSRSLAGSGAPPSQPAFCSYHSQVNVGGTEVAYVVQPWTAGTSCDEPGVPDDPGQPDARAARRRRRPAPGEPAQPGTDRRDRQPQL